MMIDYDYLRCCDCVEGMKGLPDDCINLTVTSPPYDNLREYNGFNFDFEETARQIYRITKPGGVVVWIVNDAVNKGTETGTSMRQALFFKECGFNLHDTMIWRKDTFSLQEKTRYRQCFEYMFVFSKGKPSTVNLIADRKNKRFGEVIHGTFRSADGQTHRKSNHRKSAVAEYGVRFNVWDQITEKKNNTGHPAIFPEKLAGDHIASWSNEGDIVFDPFVGSGTTARAAAKLGRHYIGFEISEDYYNIAENRVGEVVEQLHM